MNDNITIGMCTTFQKEQYSVENTETSQVYDIYRKDKVGLLFHKNSSPTLNRETYVGLQEIEQILEKFFVQKPYSLWKNGRLYYVHCLTMNVEDGDIYVVYQALYGKHLYYARKYSMFTEKIPENRKLENKTGQKYRFEISH